MMKELITVSRLLAWTNCFRNCKTQTLDELASIEQTNARKGIHIESKWDFPEQVSARGQVPATIIVIDSRLQLEKIQL